MFRVNFCTKFRLSVSQFTERQSDLEEEVRGIVEGTKGQPCQIIRLMVAIPGLNPSLWAHPAKPRVFIPPIRVQTGLSESQGGNSSEASPTTIITIIKFTTLTGAAAALVQHAASWQQHSPSPHWPMTPVAGKGWRRLGGRSATGLQEVVESRR